MKKLVLQSLFIVVFSLSGWAQDLAPFIKIGETNQSINETSEKVVQLLKEHSFTVLGTYHPAQNNSLKVIAFTRADLKNSVIKVKDRGALGAIMKVGLVKEGNKVVMSYTNPEYVLRAYLMDQYGSHKSMTEAFSADLKSTLSPLGTEFKPFGGTVPSEKLKKYHYKIMMPYFTDPIELAEFSSFEEGLKIIEQNLKSQKGNTVLAYKLVYAKEQVAVFGVGLNNKEEGEAHFLPIIGEAHAAAMPYEIILQGKEATMLHGKYRIALFWPDLTMGTFMKIMSTPGDIEDALENLCQ